MCVQNSLPAVCVLLRRNWNGTGRKSMIVMDRVMGMGRDSGAGKKEFENHESEKVFVMILDEFVGCLDIPKNK